MSRTTLVRVTAGVLIAAVLFRVAAPPLIGDTLVTAGVRSPGIATLPIISDIIQERLGTRTTDPAGSDTTLVTVEIAAGTGTAAIASQLRDAGLIADEIGFIYAVRAAGLDGKLQAGTFKVAASMTPTEVAIALTDPYREPTVAVALRAGIRLEQVIAKLSTLDLPFTPASVELILRDPPEDIRADYSWLDLKPKDSLEGRIGTGVFSVPLSTTANGFVRMLIDRFAESVPEELRGETADGRSFAEVLTLASVVEREAAIDSERARIAGVFAYRQVVGMGLGSDVTLIYMIDSAALRKLKIASWKNYLFWTIPLGMWPLHPQSPAICSVGTPLRAAACLTDRSAHQVQRRSQPHETRTAAARSSISLRSLAVTGQRYIARRTRSICAGLRSTGSVREARLTPHPCGLCRSSQPRGTRGLARCGSSGPSYPPSSTT